MAKYPKKKLAQLVLQACLKNQINRIVISPGSRNAPLTLGFVNHPEIETYSIVDERSAAFFALGMAQQEQKPVALLCTSGSALLNYYPAIAEAFYSRIPLVILSADRPEHLIGIGDGQTINQENVFANHILQSVNLVEDEESEAALQSNTFLIEGAFQTAKQKCGPVHINIPFDEPLYETVSDLLEIDYFRPELNDPIPGSLLKEKPLDVNFLKGFADIWNKSSKKMVLVGTLNPDELIRVQMEHFLKDPTVLILTESTSNLSHDQFINNIDQLIFSLDEDSLNDLKPDVLITIGGMVVSKKVKQFLRRFPPNQHWHVDPYSKLDTYHVLSHYFKISPQLFFSQFFFLTEAGKGSYQQKWLGVKAKRKRSHKAFLDRVSFSDLKVFELLLQSIPNDYLVQLSNSSVVRYTQLFELKPELKVYCNRGTSGIDGSSSTAIGAAVVTKSPTLLITGDISFFYDSNALWNAYIPAHFRIVVINNGGGGIFRFIPGPKSSNALDYFETPHGLNASNLCKMHQIKYYSADSEAELLAALGSFYEPSDRPVLLEVFTPQTVNDICLKSYFKAFTETS